MAIATVISRRCHADPGICIFVPNDCNISYSSSLAAVSKLDVIHKCFALYWRIVA